MNSFIFISDTSKFKIKKARDYRLANNKQNSENLLEIILQLHTEFKHFITKKVSKILIKFLFIHINKHKNIFILKICNIWETMNKVFCADIYLELTFWLYDK